MNLVIDIGNTQTKAALFDGGEIVETIFAQSFDSFELKKLKESYPRINQAILSSVADIDEDLIVSLENECKYFLKFNHQTPVPIGNLYESKSTLGLDRLAAAVGGSTLFPEEELMIIDAGTAITYDLIDKCNNFLGGNISPGLKMRFKALHKFTSKLPEVISQENWPEYGKNTEEAIRAGVQQGMILEIDGTISQIHERWPGCKVLLTGGDSLFFEKKLKNTIFVKFELTLIGLNRILEFNATNS